MELEGLRWESNSRPRESSATLSQLSHEEYGYRLFLYKLSSVRCQYYSYYTLYTFTGITIIHIYTIELMSDFVSFD